MSLSLHPPQGSPRSTESWELLPQGLVATPGAGWWLSRLPAASPCCFPPAVVVWFPYRHLSAGSQCCHRCCAGPWPVVNVFPRGQLAAGAGVSQRWVRSNSSACRGYVALLCPLYGQTPALPDTSFLCQTVLCLWERLPYAGLGKNGKAKRLVPLVQSGLKAQKHTDTTVVSHPFTNMHGNLCKPYRHSCGNNICSYR